MLSVFPGRRPGTPARGRGVPAPAHVEPHVERVTMHPGVLAAARCVLVVATGAFEGGGPGRAWAGGDVRELPVRATLATNATWILDEAAAADLPRE